MRCRPLMMRRGVREEDRGLRYPHSLGETHRCFTPVFCKIVVSFRSSQPIRTKALSPTVTRMSQVMIPDRLGRRGSRSVDHHVALPTLAATTICFTLRFYSYFLSGRVTFIGFLLRPSSSTSLLS